MNAKKEFEEETKNTKVICASIQMGYYERDVFINLNKGYSKKEYEEFLQKLDKEYDSGYGGQELYGTIWCEDGIWFTRGEYDGSEWWNKHQYPKIEIRTNEVRD